jgi:phosphate transport system permease protein
LKRGLIRLSGYAAVVVLLLILSFMLREGLPFLGIYSASDFLFKTDWYPLSSRYGMLPLLTGSLMVTLIALTLAMPLAIGTAIFMSEVAPPAVRNTFKILLEILASIPSVVFGFLGIIILGPWGAAHVRCAHGAKRFFCRRAARLHGAADHRERR